LGFTDVTARFTFKYPGGKDLWLFPSSPLTGGTRYLYVVTNRVLAAGGFNVFGPKAPATVKPRLVGISLGSVVGAHYLAGNTPDQAPNTAMKGLLNVPGGRLAYLMEGSPTYGGLLETGLRSLGIAKGSPEHHAFLQVTQSVIDPVDPATMATPLAPGQSSRLAAHAQADAPLPGGGLEGVYKDQRPRILLRVCRQVWMDEPFCGIPPHWAATLWPGGPGPVRIANPIYDVVFKYLLDDEKVARLVLSALLGKEVLELQFRPTEVHHEAARGDGTQLLVLRIDFAATVRLEDGGRKLVLIEIQKARNASDVQRFRRYLGSNYASPENVYLDPDGKQQVLPIVTIYFLGEGLECVDVPVLKVNRHYLDLATGDEVRITDPFVEALTHDAIVVQINRLKNRRRTDLERLLEVFDQGLASRSDPHLLDILEENFPEHHREVLRRLMRAGAEKEVRDKMDVEDDILKAFQDEARKSADLRQALAESHQVIEEKDRLIADLKRRLSRA
jgi:hypothetical protein